jgi:hypothetical protein
LTVNGPANTLATGAEIDLVGPKARQYKLPACGSGTIKLRSELKVEGKGKTGLVASEKFVDDKGVHYYGTQYGFSYDWEKCAK